MASEQWAFRFCEHIPLVGVLSEAAKESQAALRVIFHEVAIGARPFLRATGRLPDLLYGLSCAYN
jgi:hypothetical protein